MTRSAEAPAVGRAGFSWSSLSPRARAWWILAALGLIARFVLALRSEGTNDVRIWDYFAHYIRDRGLFAAYRDLVGGDYVDPASRAPYPVFNHPPLSGLYMAAAQWVADSLQVRFSLFVKLPGLVGELLSAWVLARIFRANPERAAAVVAAFAWSLCSLLVSGFHGNTDCAYAGLMLLGVYLLQDRHRPLAAGLAFAAATNVKLIPVVLIVPLLITVREWRTVRGLVSGLLLGGIPLLVAVSVAPRDFIRNVVSYTPDPNFWGIEGLALSTFANPRWADEAHAFYDWYLHGYRPFLFGALVLVAVVERVRPRWDYYQRAALFIAIFLILTPGFGVQYTVALAPLAFAVSIRWGLWYATTAGLMLLTVYLAFRREGPLLDSQFTSLFPFPAPMIGMLAWGTLIGFVAFLFRCRRLPVSAVAQNRSGGER